MSPLEGFFATLYTSSSINSCILKNYKINYILEIRNKKKIISPLQTSIIHDQRIIEQDCKQIISLRIFQHWQFFLGIKKCKHWERHLGCSNISANRRNNKPFSKEIF